jgi:hypothetical protein
LERNVFYENLKLCDITLKTTIITVKLASELAFDVLEYVAGRVKVVEAITRQQLVTVLKDMGGTKMKTAVV